MGGSEACLELLEPLAVLLSIAGRSYGTKSVWVHFQRLLAVLSRLEELSQSSNVPETLRLILCNALDEVRGQPASSKVTPKPARSDARSTPSGAGGPQKRRDHGAAENDLTKD